MTNDDLCAGLEELLGLPEGSVMLDGSGPSAWICLRPSAAFRLFEAGLVAQAHQR